MQGNLSCATGRKSSHLRLYQSDTDLMAKMPEYEVISIKKIQAYKLDTILQRPPHAEAVPFKGDQIGTLNIQTSTLLGSSKSRR